MKNLVLTAICICLSVIVAFAGVMPGDKGDGGKTNGCCTVAMRGGIMGDYKVSFTDDHGTSPEVTGTPTMGGDPGETDECPWTSVAGGGTYRISGGNMQNKNANGDPVDMGPCTDSLAPEPGEDEGSLPRNAIQV